MGTDLDEHQKDYRFEERIHKEFLVYQTCDHIIATTEPQYELLQTMYDVLERHITVIPPGMDEDRFIPIRQQEREQLQKKYKLKKHDVFVVGRMAANKGYDLLLQAMPTVFELVPDARLIAAIGSDDSKQDEQGVADLKKLAKDLGIDKKIVWTPYIPDEDLASYYQATAVFALSSRYEPFGMTAIEAMACGTPTVVTVNGGLFELINFGNQALFANPDRPVEFGTMLAVPMLYPNLAHELSVEGARFARRSFGWTGIAKRIITVFEQSAQRLMTEKDF
jgi:mannosylfructose-phosphate synthase